MEIKNSTSIRENIKVDTDKTVEVSINFYGIQKRNQHQIEESVESFLHLVEEILKAESIDD